MDRLAQYRESIKAFLRKYAESTINNSEVEVELIFDTENDHYQILRVGWRNRTQVFLVVFHFYIKNDKIWIQQNASDYDIVGDLEARGIPKSDIVLAFHSPQMRPFTGYAVA